MSQASTKISNEVFCEIMFIAYEINCSHPEWSMDKCIEQAVKGAYNLTDLKKQYLPVPISLE